MTFSQFFLDPRGRLRSGWRFALFVLAFFVILLLLRLLFSLFTALLPRASGAALEAALQGPWGLFFVSGVGLVAASLAGWLCGKLLEGLPWRALGWGLHAGWARDLLLGSVLGSLSILGAVLIGAVFGGYRPANAPVLTSLLWQTPLIALAILIVAAAFEEVLFRGFPLQTLLRSLPTWAAFIPSFVFFGLVHLNNPNVVPGFTFVNTALAGVWLSVGYLRTRSLWLPLGLHWAWNWTMGPVFGLPISGLTSLSGAPLLPLSERGPDWLTGGAYGPEGGLACSAALILSTLFLWRTRLVGATEEMKRLTGAGDEPESLPPASAESLAKGSTAP